MSQQILPASLATPAAESPARKSLEVSFLSHARLISILTLLSRALGLLRESVVAKYFGAGVVSSAFTVAFKVPNLFRKLLGEGALSAAFIPLYAQDLKTGDHDHANRFAAASVNLLTTILISLTVIGELFLWAIIQFVRLRPENLLMFKLTAIMLPYVLLICLTAFLGGVLQVHKRFGLPALTPVLLNVIHIAVVVIGARILMLRGAGPTQEALQIRLAYWLAGFVLVAGVFQIALLLPSLRAVGFRFTLNVQWWTPEIKKMFRLSLPVGLSAGVLQLSVLLDTGITVLLTRGELGTEKFHLFGHWLAYPMQVGAVARLNWAQFLYQFPLGVFAIALATAIFPKLSADAMDHDRGQFKRVLRQGIIISLWEGIAASAGLIIVRYPAIRLLFQHGSFTSSDTQWVALSVVFYSAAIWAFSLQQILNRAYYALHDTLTPLIMAIVTIAVNTAVEIPLTFTHLGEAAMAAGTLASFSIQAVVMLFMLNKKAGGLGMPRISLSILKMLLSCAAMILACWAVTKLPIYPRASGQLASLEQLLILMTTGAAAYAGVSFATGMRLKQI